MKAAFAAVLSFVLGIVLAAEQQNPGGRHPDHSDDDRASPLSGTWTANIASSNVVAAIASSSTKGLRGIDTTPNGDPILQALSLQSLPRIPEVFLRQVSNQTASAVASLAPSAIVGTPLIQSQSTPATDAIVGTPLLQSSSTAATDPIVGTSSLQSQSTPATGAIVGTPLLQSSSSGPNAIVGTSILQSSTSAATSAIGGALPPQSSSTSSTVIVGTSILRSQSSSTRSLEPSSIPTRVESVLSTSDQASSILPSTGAVASSSMPPMTSSPVAQTTIPPPGSTPPADSTPSVHTSSSKGSDVVVPIIPVPVPPPEGVVPPGEPPPDGPQPTPTPTQPQTSPPTTSKSNVPSESSTSESLSSSSCIVSTAYITHVSCSSNTISTSCSTLSSSTTIGCSVQGSATTEWCSVSTVTAMTVYCHDALTSGSCKYTDTVSTSLMSGCDVSANVTTTYPHACPVIPTMGPDDDWDIAGGWFDEIPPTTGGADVECEDASKATDTVPFDSILKPTVQNFCKDPGLEIIIDPVADDTGPSAAPVYAWWSHQCVFGKNSPADVLEIIVVSKPECVSKRFEEKDCNKQLDKIADKCVASSKNTNKNDKVSGHVFDQSCFGYGYNLYKLISVGDNPPPPCASANPSSTLVTSSSSSIKPSLSSSSTKPSSSNTTPSPKLPPTGLKRDRFQNLGFNLVYHWTDHNQRENIGLGEIQLYGTNLRDATELSCNFFDTPPGERYGLLEQKYEHVKGAKWTPGNTLDNFIMDDWNGKNGERYAPQPKVDLLPSTGHGLNPGPFRWKENPCARKCALIKKPTAQDWAVYCFESDGQGDCKDKFSSPKDAFRFNCRMTKPKVHKCGSDHQNNYSPVMFCSGSDPESGMVHRPAVLDLLPRDTFPRKYTYDELSVALVYQWTQRDFDLNYGSGTLKLFVYHQKGEEDIHDPLCEFFDRPADGELYSHIQQQLSSSWNEWVFEHYWTKGKTIQSLFRDKFKGEPPQPLPGRMPTLQSHDPYLSWPRHPCIRKCNLYNPQKIIYWAVCDKPDKECDSQPGADTAVWSYFCQKPEKPVKVDCGHDKQNYFSVVLLCPGAFNPSGPIPQSGWIGRPE